MKPRGASTWPAGSSTLTKPLGHCCACSIPFAQRATAPPRRQHCSKGRPRRGQLAQVHLLRRQRRRLRRSRLSRCHHGPRHHRPWWRSADRARRGVAEVHGIAEVSNFLPGQARIASMWRLRRLAIEFIAQPLRQTGKDSNHAGNHSTMV
jgi:hypothetical protein